MAFSFPLYGIDYHIFFCFLFIWYFGQRIDNEVGFYSCLLLTQWENWALTVMDSFLFPPQMHFLVHFCSMSLLRMYSTHTCDFMFLESWPPRSFPTLRVICRSRSRTGMSWGVTVSWTLCWSSRKVWCKEKASQTGQGPTSQRAWPGWAGLGRMFFLMPRTTKET